MNRLCSFIVLTALFSATGAGAQTNQLFGVTEDELTVIVNGREATGEEKKLHLLELDKMKSETQLKGAGIGAVVSLTKDGLPVIVSPLADTPAAKAGLTQGDVIVAIDHETTEGLALSNVISRLRGEAGSTVTVAISRLGLAQPFEVEITRVPIKYAPGMSRASGSTNKVLILRKGAPFPPEFLERSGAESNNLVEPTPAH